MLAPVKAATRQPGRGRADRMYRRGVPKCIGDVSISMGAPGRIVGLVENLERSERPVRARLTVGQRLAMSVAILDIGGTGASTRSARSERSGTSTCLTDLTTRDDVKNAEVAAIVLAVTPDKSVLVLVSLVASAGFVAVAQRRLRQLGMLGAVGATEKHLCSWSSADGAAIGVVAGATEPWSGWWRDRSCHCLERAVGYRIDPFHVQWWVVVTGDGAGDRDGDRRGVVARLPSRASRSPMPFLVGRPSSIRTSLRRPRRRLVLMGLVLPRTDCAQHPDPHGRRVDHGGRRLATESGGVSEGAGVDCSAAPGSDAACAARHPPATARDLGSPSPRSASRWASRSYRGRRRGERSRGERRTRQPCLTSCWSGPHPAQPQKASRRSGHAASERRGILSIPAQPDGGRPRGHGQAGGSAGIRVRPHHNVGLDVAVDPGVSDPDGRRAVTVARTTDIGYIDVGLLYVAPDNDLALYGIDP